jgi:hypothetical protein
MILSVLALKLFNVIINYFVICIYFENKINGKNIKIKTKIKILK